MGVGFESAAKTVTLEFWRRLWQSIIGFLLQDQIVDHFVFPLQLDFNDLKFGAQTSIFILQIVRCHPLLHDIIVEALALLMDNSRAQLMHLEVDLAGGLGGRGARSLPHGDVRGARQAELLTEIELCLSAGCARSAFGRLAGHEEKRRLTTLLGIEHLLIGEHLLLLGIVHLLLLLLHHAGVDPLAHRRALHVLLVHQVDLHLLLLLEESLLFDCRGHGFGALWTYPAHVVLNLLRLKTVLV